MKQHLFTKIAKKSFLALTFIAIAPLWGQDAEDEPKKFYWGGSVDTYFRHNLSALNDTTKIAPPTAFANDPGFAIGMVNLIAGWEGEKIGFKADLVFGPRGEESVFLSGGTSNAVNQLYVFWNVSEKWKLTLGNFNTYLGYEVISPASNFNYSTSYMFSYGPFSHTGVKVDYAITENWSAMFAIMNATDWTEFNPDDRFTYGAQLGHTWDKGFFYLNGLFGEQNINGDDFTTQFDVTSGIDFTDFFYLGLDSTWSTTDGTGFWGVALYPKFSFSENYAIGVRAEYFSEFDEGVGALGIYDDSGDASVWEFTLSGNLSPVKNLTFIPEFRIDTGSEDFFEDRDMVPSSHLSSILVAAVYSF